MWKSMPKAMPKSMPTSVWRLAVVCLLAYCTAAQDANEQVTASKLLALKNAWNLAEQRSDIRALDLLLDGGMVSIDEDGTLLTKAQYIQRVRLGLGKTQSILTQTIGVHVYGETGVVAGTYLHTATERQRAVQRQGRFIDVWIWRGESWFCVLSQLTPMAR